MSEASNMASEENQPPHKKMKTEEGEIPMDPKGQEDNGGQGEREKEKGNEGEEEGASKDGEGAYALLGRIKEEEVGITEYISTYKGISGVIKQRYSDFIVNEVSSSGEVVHLTNLEAPVVVEELEPSGPVDNVIPETFLAELKQVAAGATPGLTASMLAGDDKTLRLRLHRSIKAAFPNIETKTEEKDGVKVITAILKGKSKNPRHSEEFQWPSIYKDWRFCRFTMYKENRSTMDIIHLLAKFLKVKENLFSYAGTKDKRAKTTQEVTAFKIHPKRLQNLNQFLRNVKLGNFSYTKERLYLGDLGGNRFTIVLRNVQHEDADLEGCLTSLRDVGFINYYGLQRFGTQHSATHDIGRAILKEEWEEAVNLIIGGSGVEGMHHRKVWADTKDPSATLKACRGQQYIEKKVLRSLVSTPKDFNAALRALARNMRVLYPHSYQSLVWNKIASRRFSTFGKKPVIGDLVLSPDAAAEADVTEGQGTVEPEEADKLPGRPNGKPTPIVLDENTVSQYTIYDVVLPLPGYDVIYPNNEVRSWYKEILEKDGLDIDNMRRNQKDYSLPGGYRSILVRPTEVEWKIFRYNDVTASLCLSDVDIMNGVQEPESVPDGQLKALRLSFTMGLSAYATMALREVLKTDTSPAQQASMNVS